MVRDAGESKCPRNLPTTPICQSRQESVNEKRAKRGGGLHAVHRNATELMVQMLDFVIEEEKT